MPHFNLKHYKHYEPWVWHGGENALLDHGSIAESFIHPLGSHSDKRKYKLGNTHMRAITPEAANLFGVIVSSEQKRQTSALKSCSAWAGRGILTISPMNLVPSASKHECYQYLLHNTCTCSSQTEASPLPLVSDNIVPSEKKSNRSELWLWMWSKSVASFNWKCQCLCWITGNRYMSVQQVLNLKGILYTESSLCRSWICTKCVCRKY